MEKYHKLLSRQINKHLNEKSILLSNKRFLKAISDAYYAFDDDRLMVERSLDLSSKELNSLISELQVAQGNLVNQEKMAAIGHLAAGVAHEINNPLGYIVSNFSSLGEYTMILEKYITEVNRIVEEIDDIPSKIELNYLRTKMKIDEIIEEIPESILDSNEGLTKIRRIVNGLRQFSMVDEPNSISMFDINEGIENTLTVVSNEISKTAEIEKEYGDVPLLRVNGGEINQVIMNLVLNSAYAISERKIHGKIHVKTYRDGENINLLVKDNGIGIPENEKSKIFNPFFTTKPVGSGTGLGLSICYDIIVNKHHGKIDVVSENGEGTCFKIVLPISVDMYDNIKR